MFIVISTPEKSPIGSFLVHLCINNLERVREILVLSGLRSELILSLFHGGCHICELDTSHERIQHFLTQVQAWYPPNAPHAQGAQDFITEVEKMCHRILATPRVDKPHLPQS